MGLRRVIEDVRGREKTLTVYAPPGTDVVASVREYFASQNVAIEHEPTTDAPAHAVLSDDGEYLTSVGTDALRALTGSEPHPIGEDAAYSPLLEHLDRTTFTSYSRCQMMQASREIEDRAWRAKSGCLHAGFQRLSNLEPEVETYAQLADSDLDVHVYGERDAEIGAGESFTVHATDDPEITTTWFVVFDGGGNEQQSSALLAEEQDDGGYYGFWTYDASLVADALDALDAVRRPA
ncbi:DICT sensory domain-containing protein [Halobacterium litoreum]|uniref:DICT sensory domain-containing protein n=1 Tax=Halobacterium litoreum TaxID=2039234 RepID=A0ABD5NI91_9EURY|nr:DICT sensory domain-containing protein [Halobacterium litoreum]UHH12223.1 hypothetical protein LT972_08645 [Halobacterium litoreum]